MGKPPKTTKKKKKSRTGHNFEAEIVEAINSFFLKNSYHGYAYRIRQSRFSVQPIDIHVDSAVREFYAGIECKHVDLTVKHPPPRLYFNKFFSETNVKDRKTGKVTVSHQVKNIADHLQRTGRNGYLALELTEFIGDTKRKKNRAYFIPFDEIISSFNAYRRGDKTAPLRFDYLREFCAIDKQNGKYFIPTDFFTLVKPKRTTT